MTKLELILNILWTVGAIIGILREIFDSKLIDGIKKLRKWWINRNFISLKEATQLLYVKTKQADIANWKEITVSYWN